MAVRKRRPTFDIIVKNLPLSVKEKDVSKRFTTFGEIQGIFVRTDKFADGNIAIIKYLCEPDAVKAADQNNGTIFNKNVISVQRLHYKNGNVSKNLEHKSVTRNPSEVRTPYPAIHQPIMRAPVQNSPAGMIRHMVPRGGSLPYSNYCTVPPPTLPQYIVPKHDTGHLPVPEERNMFCTYVENAVTFYCQYPGRNNLYDTVTFLVQQICPSLPRIRGTPILGKMYATIFSGDNLWYRCIMKKLISPKKVLVHYIDYGNFEEVQSRDLVEVEHSLSVYPHLAPKCILMNFVPTTPKNKDDPREAARYLEENIVGEMLTVTTTSAVHSPMYEMSSCVWKQKEIANILLKEGFVQRANPKNGLLQNQAEVKTTVEKEVLKMATHSSPEAQESEFVPVINGPSPVTSTDVVSQLPSQSNLDNMAVSELARCQKVLALKEQELQSEMNKSRALELDVKNKENLLSKCNVFEKMQSVTTRLQLVNSIRSSGTSESDRIFFEAFNKLHTLRTTHLEAKRELRSQIDETLDKYNHSIMQIRQCNNKEHLTNIVETKNKVCDILCAYIYQYLTGSTTDLNQPVNELQALLQRLESKIRSTDNLALSKKPDSFQELQEEYIKAKSAKDQVWTKVQQNTNAAHVAFMDSMSTLQTSFPLRKSSLDEASDCPINQPYTSSELALKRLHVSVNMLHEALEAEVDAMYAREEKEPESCQLVECLAKFIQMLIENLKGEWEVKKRYEMLLDSLTVTANQCLPLITQVAITVKQIKSLRSKLRHRLADKKDLEETDQYDVAEVDEVNSSIANLRHELHLLFEEEDNCMKCLAKSNMTNVPELDIEHPELGLAKYSEYRCLLRFGWELDHFTTSKLPNRLGICYETNFLSSPVIIKEYLLDEVKSQQLIEKLLAWSSIGSRHLVEVLAIFRKNSMQTCVMFPKLPNLVECKERMNFPDCCAFLVSVLEALRDLHANNMYYGLLHPAAILIYEKWACLDFLFDVNFSLDEHLPEWATGKATEFNDMYAFGHLALNLLFPEIKTNCSTAFPNIEQCRFLIEKALPVEDYFILLSLTFEGTKNRQTAGALLQSGFLRKPKIVAKKEEDQLHKQLSALHIAQGMQIPSVRLPPQKITESVLMQETPLEQNNQVTKHENSMLSRMFLLRQPLNCSEMDYSATSEAKLVGNSKGSSITM